MDIEMNSAGSEHMVKEIRFFENLQGPEEITIETADVSTLSTTKKGRVRVRLHDGILKASSRTCATKMVMK